MSEENKDNKESKKNGLFDKILMGAVIGGAIGSVLGASIAPKKGKETRQEIVDAVKSTGENSKKLFQKLKSFFSFKKKKDDSRQNSSIKKIPNEDAVKIDQQP